jgi:hypothetical protein
MALMGFRVSGGGRFAYFASGMPTISITPQTM